jgi:hypothetical protein
MAITWIKLAILTACFATIAFCVAAIRHIAAHPGYGPVGEFAGNLLIGFAVAFGLLAILISVLTILFRRPPTFD